MAESNVRPTGIASGEELESYRSLSTLAVLSFVLGLLSLLSFAPVKFFVLFFPPAAIVVGVLALRQLAAAPEVWTGGRLAKLGIGLAVVCAGTSLALKQLNYTRIQREGRVVAEHFLTTLHSGDIEGAFWLRMPTEVREQIKEMVTEELPSQVLEQYGSFRGDLEGWGEAIARGEGTVEFQEVEGVYTIGEQEYASVIFKYQAEQRDLLVLVVATSIIAPDTHNRSWFVKELKFDYQPASYAPKPAGGHGHSH